MPTTQARKFCFTAFYEEEPVFDAAEMNYLIVGKETCPDTGRQHWQCYVEFKNKRTFNQVRRHFPVATDALKVARGTAEQNKAYCSKEGDFKEFGRVANAGQRNDLELVKNRVLSGEALEALMTDDDCAAIIARHMQYFRALANNYRSGVGLSALKARLAGTELRPWQSRLVDIVSEEPDTRSVYWFWDAIGRTGKSFAADYLIAFHGSVVFTHGKVSDIAHAYNMEPVVIFDLSRSQEDKLDGVYMCLENFKNGRFFSPKYESHCKVFKPPHVIVFANFEPDRSKLSADRWKIHHIASV